MRTLFITVIGNVGSGKSTFSAKLAQKLRAEFVAADELYKTNPFFQDAVIDRSRWSLASDVWFLMKRVEIAKELEKRLGKTSIVQDSGIPMSWVYSNSRIRSKHMNEKELDLYTELFEKFGTQTAAEDIIIYMHAPISTLMERIKQRGREFELQHFTTEYLEGLEDSLRTYVARIRAKGVTVIDCDEQSSTDVEASIQARLQGDVL